MTSAKRFFRVPANSILESVIALSVISACLFVAVLVYANVFSPKTSPVFYLGRNQVQTAFFTMQAGQQDSVGGKFDIKEEWLNTNLKKVEIRQKESKNKPEIFWALR